MEKPTYEEFVIARRLASDNTVLGEEAYQVCRWYRGQIFLRDIAEMVLASIRRERTAS